MHPIHMMKPPKKIADEPDVDQVHEKRHYKKMLSSKEMFGLSSYWFGWSALMGPLLFIVMPVQVEQLSGSERKAIELGNTLILGSIVAIIVAPVSGSISDTSTHPWGRRSPFIATGVVLVTLSLIFMAVANALWIYKAAFFLLSVANNIAMSPYTALVPDLVPQPQRGVASAWLGVMAFIGTFAGGAVTYMIKIEYCLVPLGLLHAFTGYITIRLCRERPLVHVRRTYARNPSSNSIEHR